MGSDYTKKKRTGPVEEGPPASYPEDDHQVEKRTGPVEEGPPASYPEDDHQVG